MMNLVCLPFHLSNFYFVTHWEPRSYKGFGSHFQTSKLMEKHIYYSKDLDENGGVYVFHLPTSRGIEDLELYRKDADILFAFLDKQGYFVSLKKG